MIVHIVMNDSIEISVTEKEMKKNKRKKISIYCCLSRPHLADSQITATGETQTAV